MVHFEMSMDLEQAFQLKNPKKKKKTHEPVPGKFDRKRKRDIQEEYQTRIKAKKQRATNHSGSSVSESISVIQASPVEESSLFEKTYSLYLALSPISYLHPLPGLCAEHLSPLILTYYPPFKGVILSYSNVRLSSDPNDTPEHDRSRPILAKSVDEYAVSFVWVTADFLVFAPQRHSTLEGWINLQNEGNLGLLCLNFFNVNIERRRLPKDWTWVPARIKIQKGGNHDRNQPSTLIREEEAEVHNVNGINHGEGHFNDENGNRVEGLIHFRVKDFQTSRSLDRENGFVSIEGTMLTKEEESELREAEAIRLQKRIAKRPERLGRRDSTGDPGHGSSINRSKSIDWVENTMHRAVY